MRRRIIYIVLVFLYFSIFLIGQEPNSSNSTDGNNVLTFTPASKKAHQTRFRKKYFGVLNGKDMTLTLSEKQYKERLELTVILTDLKARESFIGVKEVSKRVHHLDSLVLKNKNDEIKTIKSLFLHNYNPNFINIITTKGQVGYFFWGEEPVKNGFYAKPFISLDSYRGFYEGRIDGRPAEMKIETRTNGTQITIKDKEQNQVYWTYLNQLPRGKWFFSINELRLKSTTNSKEIYIQNLILDKDNSQIISGSFKVKNKEVGLFFIRKIGDEPSVLPEFTWPPPAPSTFLKLDFDSLKNVDRLGDINSLIIESLHKAGYQLRPNKYFYTPNGFALVTQIEQIDCEGKPLETPNRWTINISEFEKDFNLIDYLRNLSVAKEGFYRIFAFVITDDMNPLHRIEPTIMEKEAWLISGSIVLPDTIATQKLTNKHYCRIYVYDFNKTKENIHAEMVREGKNYCWRSGATHLKNIQLFFDN